MKEKQDQAPSLNSRRKKPSMRLSLFSNYHHRCSGSIDVTSSSSSSPPSGGGTLPSPIRSPSAWIRSKASDLPDIKDKYKKFTSRMGRQRRHSADFSYDPLSYSLNFQEHDDPSNEEVSYKSFTSRLPMSPPKNLISSSLPSTAEMNLLRKSRKTLSEIPVSSGEAVGTDQVQKISLNGLDLPTLGQIPEVQEIGSS